MRNNISYDFWYFFHNGPAGLRTSASPPFIDYFSFFTSLPEYVRLGFQGVHTLVFSRNHPAFFLFKMRCNIKKDTISVKSQDLSEGMSFLKNVFTILILFIIPGFSSTQNNSERPCKYQQHQKSNEYPHQLPRSRLQFQRRNRWCSDLFSKGSGL